MSFNLCDLFPVQTETLIITHTNSAEAYSGKVLGVETGKFHWVLVVTVPAVMLFVWLQHRQGLGMAAGTWIICTPAALCGLYLVFMVQGRHGSFTADVLESILTRGDASPKLNVSNAEL